jgi:hypothetical protein
MNGSLLILRGFVATLTLLPSSSSAFSSNAHFGISRNIDVSKHANAKLTANHPLFMSTSTSTSESSSNGSAEDLKDDVLLGGASTFEEWFRSVTFPENPTLNLVRHAVFPNGRGLEFIGDVKDDNANKPIVSLPKELVLRSSVVEKKEDLESIADDWDADLSIQLLEECLLGPKSRLYGYCSLLMRGESFQKGTAPPSTALNALRNWTPAQKEYLSSAPRGQKLLNFQEKQSQEWEDKYTALPKSDQEVFTLSQFLWAMEAVHSRAFKGEYGADGGSPIQQLANALVPFAGVAFALNYVNQDPSSVSLIGENAAIALGLLSCAPILLNFVSLKIAGETKDAVLLPFIDSANHLETARSEIEFDPLNGAFTLSLSGEKSCLKKEGVDGESQLYITYGTKRDTELLLNYGFIPGIVFDDGCENLDEQRRILAEAFHSRGSDMR